MPWSRAVQEEALFRSRRCCCMCHEFAGLYVNVHHIVPEADGGASDIDNAVVLCLRCHGEVGHYNPKHPIGARFRPDEVRRHRDAWWSYIGTNPAVPLPLAPISLSPSLIRIPRGTDERHRYELEITNLSDRTLYSVTIVIVMSHSGLGDDCIELPEMLRPEPRPWVTPAGSVVSVQPSLLMVRSISSTGHRHTWLVVSGLAPRTTYTMPIIVTAPAGAVPEDASALVMLAHFAREQAPLIERPSEVEPGWTELHVLVNIHGKDLSIGVATGPAKPAKGD